MGTINKSTRDDDMERLYLEKMHQMDAFNRAARSGSFSGRSGKFGGSGDGFSGNSGKIKELNGARENNNRPASRNTIVNWPEGGPKPIRRRGHEDSDKRRDRFSGKSGKF